jgi:hypothetical protein
MAGEYKYYPSVMGRRRIRLAVRTLTLFCITIAGGVLTDQLPAYRARLVQWDMGGAFLFTLPTIGLALLTYWSGWQLRKMQSETHACYRVEADGLVREAPGEKPERTPWAQIETITDTLLTTRSGGSFPFYPGLIASGDQLLAEIQTARSRSASEPTSSPAKS